MLPLDLRRIEQRQLHIFERAGTRQQIEGLEYEADAPAADASQRRLIQLRDVDALQQVLAAGRAVQAAENVHQRGLAGPRGAHDRDELAAVDRQPHAAQCVHLGVAQVIDLGRIAHAMIGSPGQRGPAPDSACEDAARRGHWVFVPGGRSPPSVRSARVGSHGVDDDDIANLQVFAGDLNQRSVVETGAHPHRDQLAVTKQPYARRAVPARLRAITRTACPPAQRLHRLRRAAGPRGRSYPGRARSRRTRPGSGRRRPAALAARPRDVRTRTAAFARLTRESLGIETNRRQRDSQHVAALGGDDVRVGRHAGKQRQIVILDIDHDIIGHDVLHGDRSLANLADRAPERAVRIALNGEVRRCPGSLRRRPLR